MNDEENNSLHDLAKKMIIDGETFDAIMEKRPSATFSKRNKKTSQDEKASSVHQTA